MNSSANIHSLDALRELRAALVKFREEASNALVSVEVEAHRAFDWLSNDQLSYWQHELRRREDKVNECKTALARCQLMKLPGGETPSCDDEKKQLRRAVTLAEEAADKIKLVKKWTMAIAQEMTEYRGPAQQLDTMLNAQLIVGIEDLDSRIRSIEAYLQTVSEGGDLGLPSGSGESGGADADPSKPAGSTSSATPPTS